MWPSDNTRWCYLVLALHWILYTPEDEEMALKHAESSIRKQSWNYKESTVFIVSVVFVSKIIYFISEKKSKETNSWLKIRI